MFLLHLQHTRFYIIVTSGDIGTQSQYQYTTTSTSTPKFDWNITITSFMSIDKPTTEQGIYNLRSSYTLDDRSYDVELFKMDCETAPTGIDGSTFPLIWKDETNAPDSSDYTNDIELEWTYNQTEIEMSDLWTANKTGGDVYFCIRVNNYLPEGGDAFSREMNFLEVKYHIMVDSLTDFNATIDIEYQEPEDNFADKEFINYEEEIEVYQCDASFVEITSPPALTQGDYLQLCVKTPDESKFGVHSIKELDVSQNSTNLYPYIDGFITSPLAETACMASNTTDAVCRAKMQLLSAYFDEEDPLDLFALGTVKLDYVGRRLSVDVPMKLRSGEAAAAAIDNRVLAESEGDASFGIEVELSGEERESESSGIVTAAGGVLTAGAAVLAAGLV